MSPGSQLCPRCGALVSRDEIECYRCHARLRGGSASLRRVFGGLIPHEMPIVTIALIVACVAMYVVTVKVTYDAPLAEEMRRSFTPDGMVVLKFGATNYYAIGTHCADERVIEIGVKAGEWWRLVTPIFLHGGLLHIIMNCLALWTVGQLVERMFGRGRMLVVFLLTGIAGAALTTLWRHTTPGVGASGAIFGLIGFVTAFSLRRRGRATAQLRSAFVPWLIYGVVFSFLPGIDWAAHFGGLGAGALLGLVMADRDTVRRTPDLLWNVLAGLGVALVIVCFYLALHSPLWC